MTSDQHTYTQPIWLKPLNLAVGGLIMLFAAIMNVVTHAHLAARIPDWAGLTFFIPAGLWLYAALSTINWSVAPSGTDARAKAFKAVKIAAGLMEVMNLGEHTWAFMDEHGKLGPGLIPLLLLGTVPAALDILSAHLVGSVLSADVVPAAKPISETVEVVPISETPPAPPVSEIVELPTPKPVPEIEPPTPPAEPPVSETKPAPERLVFADHQRKRQAVVNQIAWWIQEIREDPKGLDPKKILRGPELLRRLPDLYTEKNLMNCRRDAFAQLDGPEITIMTDTEEETA